MRKTFPLRLEGKHPDRLLDATKHEIRKYLRRERRRALPPGMDYWDFDCRFGPTAEAAEPAPVGALIGLIDAQVQAGSAQFYVEILARAARRPPRADAPQGGADPKADAGAD